MPFSVTVARDTLNVLVPVQIQEGQFLRKKNMEMQSDNLESDPFKPQGTGLDFTQRKITYDIKSHINGYCELLAEKEKAFY